VGELDRTKLHQLLELKYHTVHDAVEELGSVADIKEVFIGFQQYLYSQEEQRDRNTSASANLEAYKM
jgi:type I restriction enzyme R subunit